MASPISYTSGGQTVQAKLYLPPSPTKGVVVIAYGIDGLFDNERGPWATMIGGYAEDLAGAGAVALIPDYLAATGTAPGAEALDTRLARRDVWAAMIADAVGPAKSYAAAGSRVGLLGFSFGGHLCLRERARADALSAYFAPVETGIGPAVGGRSPSHAELHHGDADRLVASSDATAIDATLRAEGVATHLDTYPGANHGFVGGDPDNTAARARSKSATLAFFAAHL
ncbi:MAG: dienelactone hydrolase family protein [Gemmataceae bacterium]|nr:dienelactone hydrolase family protein [Gemmataceae bacterium]